MTFSEKFIHFFTNELRPDVPIPEDIEWLFPQKDDEVKRLIRAFGNKFFNDERERTFLIGINPGRFGAGITGINFTDPLLLEEKCGISNPFDKRNELSAVFIYEIAEALGGVEAFYRSFYLASISPLGFVSKGKNLNYYDRKDILEMLDEWIPRQMSRQIEMGARRDLAYSVGKGKNVELLKSYNRKYGWFGEIRALPHPRWVMQYQRKHKQEWLQKISTELQKRIV